MNSGMQTDIINTTLYQLCCKGDLNGIDYLITNYNGDVNYTNERGDTLLLAAYKHGHLQVFQYLLAHHALNGSKHNLWLYLFDAVDKGFLELVKLLSGFCNSTDLNDALIIASLSGNLAIVEWLIFNRPVNINYRNNTGMTPLLAAISRDHWNVIGYLIVIARVTPSEFELRQCMRRAVEEGCIDKIKVTLPLCNNQIINDCLIMSSHCGHVSIVHWLLCNTSADYTYIDKQGCTPFIAACCQGHWDVVKYFVNTERINLSQSDTWMYLVANAGKHIPEISVSVLIEFSSLEQRKAALFDSCEKGHLNVVELLVVRAGVDVNCKKFSWGHTTLTAACGAGQWNIVDYIINTDSFDSTKHDMFEILLDATHDNSTEEFKHLSKFVSDFELNLLLYDASSLGNIEVVRWLILNSEIDVNFKRDDADDSDDDDYNDDSESELFQPYWSSFYDNHTTVTIACKRGYWNIVKCLIRSSTFDAKKQPIWRLLFSAVLAEQVDEVKIFAQYCCDGDTINDALVIASKQGNLDIVQWLVSICDADVNHHSDMFDDETCLTIACEEWNWDVVEYLIQLPNIDREEHELCEYIFEKVDEGICNGPDIVKAYLEAKFLRMIYHFDSFAALWESQGDREQ